MDTQLYVCFVRYYNPLHEEVYAFRTQQSMADFLKSNTLNPFKIIKEDIDGKLLPDNEWYVINKKSQVVLKGKLEIEKAEGTLDSGDRRGHVYTFKNIQRCTVEELKLIAKKDPMLQYDGNYSMQLQSIVLHKLGMKTITSVEQVGYGNYRISLSDGEHIQINCSQITPSELRQLFCSKQVLESSFEVFIQDVAYLLSSDDKS